MNDLIWQLIVFAIVIVFILFFIIKLKLNAAITLVLGSILMGFLVGLSVPEILEGITTGFGSMLGSIGLSIGFGIMLGQLMSDTKAAHVIADRIVALLPENKAIYALGLAAFVLSIPVFFDVTFVILIPIGLAVLPRTNKSIAHLVGSLAIGAGLAHMLVPPTPAPLAAGEIFGFDVGVLIAIGVPLGLIAVFVSIWLYSALLDRAILKWHPETDIVSTPAVAESEEQLVSGTRAVAQVTERPKLTSDRPGTLVALIPLAIPLVLILATTVVGMLVDPPSWLVLIGDKTVAMLIGALSAFIIGLVYLGRTKAVESVEGSLSSLGTVLLITGAGGAFAGIIDAAGIAENVRDGVGSVGASPMLLVTIAFAVGVLLRVATGSGTVAALTSMPIIASAAAETPAPLPLLALACLAGSLAGSTVNDSGFWIVTKLSGFSVPGGIKTYTVPVAITAVVVFICLLVWAAIVQLVA
jgi:GntP family gluconate:H+ symporter